MRSDRLRLRPPALTPSVPPRPWARQESVRDAALLFPLTSDPPPPCSPCYSIPLWVAPSSVIFSPSSPVGSHSTRPHECSLPCAHHRTRLTCAATGKSWSASLSLGLCEGGVISLRPGLGEWPHTSAVPALYQSHLPCMNRVVKSQPAGPSPRHPPPCTGSPRPCFTPLPLAQHILRQMRMRACVFASYRLGSSGVDASCHRAGGGPDGTGLVSLCDHVGCRSL